MENQNPPSFEDLQPEGDDSELPGDLEHAGEYEDEYLDASLMGTLGEYEFEDSDEFVDLDMDDRYAGNGRGRHRRDTLVARDTLAKSAARMALKWAGRSATRSDSTPRRTRRSEQDYLGERDKDPFDIPDKNATCSAGLVEEQELMEALATAAAATESKAEAERLIAAIVPASIRLVPHVYRALWPALPALIQGCVGVTRMLHSRRATRPMLKVMPAILQDTATQLARYVEQGQPIRRRLTARVLARQTAAALQRRHNSLGRPTHSRRSARRSGDPYSAEEWWDDGFSA